MSEHINNPYIDFKFGNHYASEYGVKRTSQSNRYQNNLFPTLQLTKTQTSKNGWVLIRKVLKEKDFSISIAFDHMTQQQFNDMGEWLSGDLDKLVFDEEPNSYYWVKLKSIPTLNYVCFEENDERIYKGEGKIEFVSFDGIKYKEIDGGSE